MEMEESVFEDNHDCQKMSHSRANASIVTSLLKVYYALGL